MNEAGPDLSMFRVFKYSTHSGLEDKWSHYPWYKWVYPYSTRFNVENIISGKHFLLDSDEYQNRNFTHQ